MSNSREASELEIWKQLGCLWWLNYKYSVIGEKKGPETEPEEQDHLRSKPSKETEKEFLEL